ncbi:hypothetical protein ABAZ39_07330 [Azospirillum argentinense]|uniref:Uncharacterized protein n=1 Tax=Azospirillum argentinense TaxID=2970906 RepID=A0A060DCC8_9PROT|nr:hypothetical protein [Azospirillum argentinense]AIB11811.1 hypothetical protein ABAZ39_07330 [Azospirillum argentinense]EZQ09770.1 hypothetical protein ABAZ39_08745 [Azospirillum argentinense]
MKLIATPARPAAPPMTIEDLEQMDDHAHTSGRAKALGRVATYQPPYSPTEMLQRWRERAERHRGTAWTLCSALRYLRNHPEADVVRVAGCDWTERTVLKELAHQRDRHRQCCVQLGFWLRRIAEQQPEPAATVRPDLGQTLQLGALGLSLVIDVWEDATYVASIDDDGQTLDTALLDRARAAFLLNDSRRWLLVTPEAAKTWFADALRRAKPLQILAAE